MAHTKQLGSSKNLRDSESKRLGIKRQQGQKVNAGEILIRQRGTKYIAGLNVRRGGDDSLYAARAGVVSFTKKKKKKFDGNFRYATMISIVTA